ncbi:TPA: LOW QUALITY PROTEIN: hypothetical protein N0F65_012538 [Lagenidium giganteum]|uniref:Uncharacterized protein n=1 Tax=Lagenidium giganteum TaxID=4803 RepID=A0AAV2YP20_9STRA|nr:TPA: LOW QUALITY PROTEIN: hypothetical protein N0F65_012538 [Lagenidium giganteum]
MAPSKGVLLSSPEDAVRRCMSGTLRAVVQYNPAHTQSTEAAAATTSTTAATAAPSPPVQKARFDFTQVSEDMVAMEKAQRRAGVHAVLVNVSPLVRARASSRGISHSNTTNKLTLQVPFHFLVVLDCFQQKPQQLDDGMITEAILFTSSISAADFAMGFNSRGAWSSVDHIHFQGYFLAPLGDITGFASFPVLQHDSREMFRFPVAASVGTALTCVVSTIPTWPVRCFSLHVEGSSTVAEQAMALGRGIQCLVTILQTDDTPFNMVITRWPVLRAVVFPRKPQQENGRCLGWQDPSIQTSASPRSFRFAVAELAGLVVATDQRGFDVLSEDMYARILTEEISISQVRSLSLLGCSECRHCSNSVDCCFCSGTLRQTWQVVASGCAGTRLGIMCSIDPNITSMVSIVVAIRSRGSGRVQSSAFQEARKRGSGTSMGAACGVMDGNDVDDNAQTLSMKHFEVHRVVGKGGFGKVNAVIRKKTKPPQWFALKTLSKVVVVQRSCVRMIWNERNLLATIRSPHIVAMHHAFQDVDNCYVVMDLLLGGDLKFQMQARTTPFSESDAKFYAAGILLSLQYLHSQQILHRDVKPDNVILDNKGYPRLTDLGVSVKTETMRFRSNSGTTAYMAPELLRGNADHGVASDLYSLGIVVFELVFKKRPWKGSVQSRLDACPDIWNGLTEELEVKYYPEELLRDSFSSISPVCKDLLRSLLHPLEEKRLGFKGGVDEVMKHEYFAEFDWSAYEAQTMKPPFAPVIDETKVNCNTAVHDFDDVLERSSRPSIRVKRADQDHFIGFEFNVDLRPPAAKSLAEASPSAKSPVAASHAATSPPAAPSTATPPTMT